MHGSAAVIGLQMLPVLGTVVPREEAAPHAAALGVAFQLTNFLRDVGEDLDRGRVYLPEDLLAAHGVDRELLQWSRDTGATDPRIRSAFVEAAHLTRGVYREAEPGLDMLDRRVRPCIRTAFTLYGGILDAIADDELPRAAPALRRAPTPPCGRGADGPGRHRRRTGTHPAHPEDFRRATTDAGDGAGHSRRDRTRGVGR